ncbi:MAG: hypothetical protein WBB32_08090 [Flavobacteriales bacterium]|nr:hypothetical protein [Flavobacteriales bacterium]
MNIRRTIGYVIWLLAFLIPLQPALLSTEGISNVTGLISFIALVILVFVGYFLVDGANAAEKAKAQHGH